MSKTKVANCEDLAATVLYLAGIDAASEVFDPSQNRMRRINDGRVIGGLL